MVGTNKEGAFQCLGDKYVIQVLDGPTKEGASLGLLIAKEKELWYPMAVFAAVTMRQ